MSAWPDSATRTLQDRLLAAIDDMPAGFVVAGDDRAACYGLDGDAMARLEARFDELALELFAYQYERVPLYRRWCDSVGRTPIRVRRAVDVPALPVEAFRDDAVQGFPPDQLAYWFHTSGTTSAQTGTLRLDDTSLYEASLLRGFLHHVLPDRDSMCMLQATPDLRQAPHSSLAFFFERVRARWGTGSSAVFVEDDTLQAARLQCALEKSCQDQEPVLLLGTALAWMSFLDTCAATSWHVQLPAGSRLFETGGYKGRRRTLSRVQLLGVIHEHFGIAPSHVVSEYGMTELASQFYTLNLRRALLHDESSDSPVWSYPAWLRPRLLVADAELPQQPEDTRGLGLLSHHDLANRCSVAHLLTADIGLPVGCSFTLDGRASIAGLRGCGLSHEYVHADEASAQMRAAIRARGLRA